MPNYKVVDADQLDADLESVADAIRAKGGTAETLAFPSGFVSAVEGIEAGGGDTSGGDIDALITRSITAINSNVPSIGQHAFYRCTELAAASFPVATAVYAYAFYGCTKLRDFQAQYVQQIRDYAFHSCTGLVSLSALNVISLSQYGFYGCTGLVDIYFSKLNAVPASAFYGCRSLELADMGAVTSIAASAFYNCYKLKALVLRGTTVATLTYVSALSNCYWLKGTTNTTYNPSGEQGYVYVPAALLEKYAAATNWVSAGVQFRALEYYTVDGTITGALDESKI